MILADTSVWVDHLRRGVPQLASLLEQGGVVIHPWIVGELACGRIRNRTEILGLLNGLPVAPMASQEECLHFLEIHDLMGSGIGFVDVHLLVSVALGESLRLWTSDRRLARVAGTLDLGWEP